MKDVLKNVPAELLYVLMFLTIALFQYLMKRFGPQAPQEPASAERPGQFPGELPEVSTVSAAAGMAAGGFSRGDAPAAAPPHRRFSRSSLMGTRRGVQDAVVVATILGPCRAFEPHDIRQ